MIGTRRWRARRNGRVNHSGHRRICFAAHDPGLQGAERAMLDMAVLFRDSGWDVAVLIPGRDGGLWELAVEHGFSPLYVRYLYWMGPGGWLGRAHRTLVNVRAYWHLRRLFLDEAFDVVYTHSTAVGVTARAAKSVRAAHVWHMHEYGPLGVGEAEPVYDFGVRATMRAMRRSGSVFVAVAHVIANAFRPHLGEDADIRVVYQPVPFDAKPDAADAPAHATVLAAAGPRLLCVGAVTPTKRQEDAVRALPDILANFPDVTLFLVGRLEPEYWARLRNLSDELGVRHAVVPLGQVRNAPALMEICDITINCRVVEASPRVLVESMFAKTLAVAAGAGGNVESLPAGLGLLYRAGVPHDLAAKVLWALGHPEETEAIVSAAHQFAVATRSESNYARQYLADIESAIHASLKYKDDDSS